jgi:hypothetical protein
VKVKMSAGPFEIDPKAESIITKSALRERRG